MIILMIIATLILSFIGFYNGYPLVYSDTGTYIYSGFDHFIPKDRPITYGLFIDLFSFHFSLWTVIIVQNFITAWVMMKVMQTLEIRRDKFTFIYLAVIAFLVFFTGIGWYTNQVMPDFFAPLSILIIYILLENRHTGILSSIVLYILLVFSLITHFSHMLIGLLLILGLFLLKYSWKRYFHHLSLKRLIILAACAGSAWIVLPGVNYLVEKKFILSKGSHVFLMGHLVDTGIMQKFLDEKCKDPEYAGNAMCQYKDVLPVELAQFIWNDSILEKTGGWEDSREGYNQLIRGTLKDPKYLGLNIFKSATYGLIQLTQNEIGQGLTAYGKGSAPWGQIYWRFRDEVNNYLNSRQNKWNGAQLTFTTLNKVQNIILYLSVFLMLGLFSKVWPVRVDVDDRSMTFLLFILMAVVLNAFVTAGLNSPVSRFQARVVWMIPFALLLLMVKNDVFCRESKEKSVSNP